MTAPSAPPRAPFTVKGWHVAAGVVAFFAVVIGVDAAFLTLAYRTHRVRWHRDRMRRAFSTIPSWSGFAFRKRSAGAPPSRPGRTP